MIEGIRFYEGFWVPEDELEKALRRRLKDVDRLGSLTGFCKHRRVIVEAGANWGRWAVDLAGLFQTVYAVEPEPRNFTCLALNTAHLPSVVRLQAALGNERGCIGLETVAGKSGVAHVNGAGAIPVLRIDDLALPACDAIALDVEGFEIQALRGARETIERYRPVLLVEDKGHTLRAGDGPRGATVEFVKKLGYEVAMPVGKDFILVPK